VVEVIPNRSAALTGVCWSTRAAHPEGCAGRPPQGSQSLEKNAPVAFAVTTNCARSDLPAFIEPDIANPRESGEGNNARLNGIPGGLNPRSIKTRSGLRGWECRVWADFSTRGVCPTVLQLPSPRRPAASRFFRTADIPDGVFFPTPARRVVPSFPAMRSRTLFAAGFALGLMGGSGRLEAPLAA
jgi:hypothetical protein